MEYVNGVIGKTEMYVPVNDKLGEIVLLAHKRLNYKKHIAKMRKAYKGKIEKAIITMDSDFFYALEDVLEEKGYDGAIHNQFEKCSIEQKKILYDLIRSDKSMRHLIAVCGYSQEQVQSTIITFFEALKKIII